MDLIIDNIFSELNVTFPETFFSYERILPEFIVLLYHEGTSKFKLRILMSNAFFLVLKIQFFIKVLRSVDLQVWKQIVVIIILQVILHV